MRANGEPFVFAISSRGRVLGLRGLAFNVSLPPAGRY